ncbi:MAG TPA: AMP-binding protein [Candidatus Omnitrophota bacterium]|mgnify:CR=1 FL=1|nr:AMP-binding protein [Candidatus Omnitrophota bacterium]
MDIKQLLIDKANVYSGKAAIIFKDQKISFSNLSKEVFRLAHALKGLGVGKGDKVGIYLPNCPEYVYSYLAVFCLGATGVPLDFMLKEDEIVSCLSHCEAKYLIYVPKENLLPQQLKSVVPTLKEIISLQPQVAGSRFYQEFVSQAKTDAISTETSQKDTALIMYTSGTTGKPKGVVLNYKHLDGSPAAMHHFVDLSDKDTKLCALPLSHIAGLIYIQNSILFGITLVLMERFNPVDFLRNVQEYKITCFHVVPAMYMAFLTLKNIDKFDLSSIRWMVVFGAPSSPDMMRLFKAHCPNARLLNGWGMTETCPPNTVTPLDSDKIESVGKVAPHCEIRIFDEEEKELAPGEIGEIVIRGWVVMDGYYKDPETTKSLIWNGWFHTGDLGRFDEEGFLYIVGRKKEMIKVAGQIVYAPEVETALHKHPAVAEVAVIGIADKLRGEAVKAFVTLKPGVPADAQELRFFAKDHLASFKVPQEILILQELPKNRLGKIDKEALKKGN